MIWAIVILSALLISVGLVVVLAALAMSGREASWLDKISEGEMVEPRGDSGLPEVSPFTLYVVEDDGEITTAEKYAIDSGDLKDGRAR